MGLALGADVRFATELTEFSQDEDAVSARVSDLRSGAQALVRASYMVAADGLRSGVRAALGVQSEHSAS
jgi:2-polyprenyl-6-methoxyphenol hydroxylase-like FAD-dependent oxidoreductase